MNGGNVFHSFEYRIPLIPIRFHGYVPISSYILGYLYSVVDISTFILQKAVLHCVQYLYF